MKRRRVVEVDREMMARKARTERVASKSPTLKVRLSEFDFRCVLVGKASEAWR